MSTWHNLLKKKWYPEERNVYAEGKQFANIAAPNTDGSSLEDTRRRAARIQTRTSMSYSPWPVSASVVSLPNRDMLTLLAILVFRERRTHLTNEKKICPRHEKINWVNVFSFSPDIEQRNRPPTGCIALGVTSITRVLHEFVCLRLEVATSKAFAVWKSGSGSHRDGLLKMVIVTLSHTLPYKTNNQFRHS